MAGAMINAAPRGGGAFWTGPGYIGGCEPGIVTAATAPAQRLVLAMERTSRLVVGHVFSSADGTYRIDNLNPDLRFDIIGRDHTNTFEDVIVSRVSPVRYLLSAVGAFTPDDATNTLTGAIAIAGGVPPLSVAVIGTAPIGISFGLTAASSASAQRVLSASGTGANGAYSWTLRVTDTDGRYVDLPCSATFA